MSLRVVFRMGIAAFAALLAMSLLLFKERTVFLDISLHLFNILKDHQFAIQNYRFGAFFTQLFPLIGSKMGLPIASIAAAYSASFVLLLLITFCIINRGFGNVRLSLTYLFSALLMTTHTFYWIQSELPQGLAFCFILLAWMERALNKSRLSPGFVLGALPLLAIVAFTHPLLLFPLCFALAYYAMLYPKEWRITGTVLLGFCVIYFIKSRFFKTAYDREAMEGLRNIKHIFPHYLGMRSNSNLMNWMLHDYYLLALGLIAVLLYYMRSRQWLKAIFLSGSFFGYIFLVNVSYPDGAAQFYLENQYLILAVFVAFPLAFEVLPAIRRPGIAVGITAAVLAVSVLRIWLTHDLYMRRLGWFRTELKEALAAPQKKRVFPAGYAPKDLVQMFWGSAYEWWLLSTLEQGEAASLILEEKPHEYDWALGYRQAFITKWGAYEYKNLDKKYFPFRDTSGYVRIGPGPAR